MNKSRAVGLFGKLPAHGDFIYRDLPSGFINAWDAWLQAYVGSSREQIGEGWLDIYLTSPIWRFALSEGVIDQNAWAGIFLPSVDRVGRYFPFSIACRINGRSNPLALIDQAEWFEAMESAALQALEGRLHIDQLVEEINLPRLESAARYTGTAAGIGPRSGIIEIDMEARALNAAFPWLLDASIRAESPSYSVWATQGSERVEPCFFYSRGLPRMQGIAALMEGSWQEWGWPEPYRLSLPRALAEAQEHGPGE